MIGIYRITSPNGKVYIGQSVDIEKRFKVYKRLSCKSQTILYRSFIKYGVENHKFEIIIECLESELNELERYYQDLYSAIGLKGLNCKLTKTDSLKGRHSEETKKKLSIALKGKKTGRKMSEENKRKISERSKGNKYGVGKKMPEHLKEKMLKIHIGNKHNLGKISSEEKKRKISEANKGNKHTLGRKLDEWHIEIIRKTHKGKKVSEESKLKMSESRRKTILNLETGIFHFGVKEVSDTYGFPISSIRSRLNGIWKNNTSLIYV